MPRSTLNKKNYIIADFAKWIKGEMWSRGLSQAEMGTLLGITQQGFSDKLKSGKFNIKEIIIIFHEFDTPPEKIGKLLKY